MELGKSAIEYKVASIFLLELAEFLLAFQLDSKYQLGALIYISFSSPIYKDILIFPRILKDFKPKFNRVIRRTFIVNENFVGFFLSP